MDEKCEFKLLPCNASEKAVLGLVITYRQKGGGGGISRENLPDLP